MIIDLNRSSYLVLPQGQKSLDLFELQRRLGGVVSAGGCEWHGPGPGHSSKDQSLHVTIKDDGRILRHSFAGDSLEAVDSHIGLERQVRSSRSPPTRARNSDRRQLEIEGERCRRINWCADLWAQTLQPQGSPIEAYLKRRGLYDPIPRVLRYHPSAPLGYVGDHRLPAMVAMIQSGTDDRPIGLHVTYLTLEGKKAALLKSKMIYGLAKDGAVRLASPICGHLAVAEGIETALSYTALTSVPCQAALSAVGLEGFRPPQGVSTLIIAADGDAVGRNAAQRLAEVQSSQRQVRISAAPEGTDWNDQWLTADRYGASS